MTVGHIFILIGVFLIAGGTWLTIYGSQLNSRRDNAAVDSKISTVLGQLESEKRAATTAAGAPSVKQIDKLQEDFSSWADDFLKKRSSRKAEFQKQQMDRTSAELATSAKWMPIIENGIQIIEQLYPRITRKPDHQLRSSGCWYRPTSSHRKPLF